MQKKKKKSEVGMFESAPTFDYLRNIIDHFSSKVASTEVVQSQQKFTEGSKCIIENEDTLLHTVNWFQTNAAMSLKRIIQDIHFILLDTEMNMPGTKSVLL